jgi:ankyrin repeat protein
LLLERGADIEAKDKDGLTPLFLAIKAQIMTRILDIQKIDLLLNKGADINARDIKQCTVLRRVSRCDNVALVQYLLDKDADVH